MDQVLALGYGLVKYVLFTRTDADEPGMRVVLHEEQRERFNAGSLLGGRLVEIQMR